MTHKPAEDLLTGEAFKAALQRVNLSQRHAAKWFPMSLRHVNRIAKGKAVARGPLVKLLRLMSACGMNHISATNAIALEAENEAELHATTIEPVVVEQPQPEIRTARIGHWVRSGG